MSHIFDTPRAWPGPKPQPEPSVELDVTLIEALNLHIQRKYKLQKDAADAWGVSSAFVSKVLHGRSKPTQAMLDDAGIVISKTFSAGSVERRALVDAATSPDVLSRQSPVEADTLRIAAEELIAYVEKTECRHESTHRGGSIWTICDDCGRKWADDKGGFKPYKTPKEVRNLRTAMASGADREQRPAATLAGACFAGSGRAKKVQTMPRQDIGVSDTSQGVSEAERKSIMECVRAILPKVKGKFPAEQALEELARAALRSEPT